MSKIKFIKQKKPIRMWIDGKCFPIEKRKNIKTNYYTKYQAATLICRTDVAESAKEKGNENKDVCEVETMYVEEEVRITNPDNVNNLFNILQNENGKFFTTFSLPKLYYNKLASFYKHYIEKLSDTTRTEIDLPKKENDYLTISGMGKSELIEASNEILSVIGEIREQNMALQFISIPCLSEEIKENFEKFKSEILNGDKIDGMHESIFQSPEKLHLTINVFVLLDQREISEAIRVLEEYGKNILNPLIEKTGPLRIRVSGIECMNNNLQKVDVLYAKAKICEENEDKSLQKIADDIQEYFYERGLVKNYKETVKLHMTIMNTKYRKEIGDTESPEKSNISPKKNRRWVKRKSFDARTIMEKYKNYEFGECNMDSVQLSLMGSVDADTGFYKPLSVVKLGSDSTSSSSLLQSE